MPQPLSRAPWAGEAILYRRSFLVLLLFAACFCGGPAFARPERQMIERSPGWADSDRDAPLGSLFSLRHHGGFRFRSGLYWRGDLGTRGTSGIPSSPLESRVNEGFEGGWADSQLLAGANIRLRYQPEMLIGERIRVHAIIDALDNLVMGSTPAFGPRADALFMRPAAGGQAPPTSGINSFKDSVHVKALWGELLLFDAITIRLGRIPDQWGLGILRNAGLGVDDDFGAAVDRAEFMGSYAGYHLGFSWDFFYSGVTSASRAQPLGQPYGYTTADTIGQWIVFLESRPRRIEELRAREHDLFERRRPVFDWGVMSVFRTQETTSERQDRSAPLEDACLLGPDSMLDIAFDCIRLAHRDAFLWYPDIWARLLWAPRPGHLLQIEIELAMAYGHVSSSELLRRADTSKDILQGGGVLRAQYHIGPTEMGLEFGFATGDDTGGVFGIQDGSEVVDVESPSAQSFQVRNRRLTNFKFARAYTIDYLLYREVIGAVTNSWYLKPWAQHTFYSKGDLSLGVRLDLLFARAFVAAGTPGQSLNLGFEADVTGFLRLAESFDARLIVATLVPFNGLDNADLGLAAAPSVSVQARLFWNF